MSALSSPPPTQLACLTPAAPPLRRVPHRFSPSLQLLVDEAMQSPNRANVFTADEVNELIDAGVRIGREEAARESSQLPSTLVCALAWFVVGAVTWGAIGLAAGYALRAWQG